jgi:hypothetical protein
MGQAYSMYGREENTDKVLIRNFKKKLTTLKSRRTQEVNMKTDLEKYMLEICGLDSSGSG